MLLFKDAVLHEVHCRQDDITKSQSIYKADEHFHKKKKNTVKEGLAFSIISAQMLQ